MRDYRPFLQIVHVADLHVVAPAFAGWPAARAFERWVGTFAPPLAARLRAGDAPHDPGAARAFGAFLDAVTVEDPLWRRLPTWLVASGGATSFGDEPSLALAHEQLRRLARAAAPGRRVVLRGSRDAWPAMPPVMAAPARVVSHRARLLTAHFPLRWPGAPLCERAPTGRLEVQLYALDTVRSEAAATTLERGTLDADQLARLASLAEHCRADNGVGTLRLLATHHPLLGDGGLARDGLGAASEPPVAHVVLSGHAHALAPALGHLARASDGAVRQLVVGSLLQHDAQGRRGPWAQQCQLLRVYYSAARPRAALIERLVAARAFGAGPFRFVPVPGAGDEVAEEFVVEV